MPVNIAIPIVDNLLGHSVIYDEYKGDLFQARNAAETNLNAARYEGNLPQLTDALLACGIVHVLRGEPPAALAKFSEIERLAANDPARQLRAISYANMATYLRYNTFPNGSGALSREIKARWDPEAYVEQQSRQRANLLNHVEDPTLLLETHLVYDLLSQTLMSHAFLDISRTLHSGVKTEQYLRTALTAPSTFRQRVEALNAWPGLLAYADLIAAEQCRRAEQPEYARQYLSQAHTTYHQVGDLVGLASCRMKWGDWIAAAYSTPLVWNCAIAEGLETSELPWSYEAPELDQSHARLPDARAAYIEAERLFSEAGARRGLAAIQLRYDYLAAVAGNYDQAADHANEAQRIFEATGDQLGAWVARAHQALSLVGAGRIPEDAASAEALGSWARERGSFSFGLGLGILFSRVGRRWMIRDGDYERAMACHRLAESLHSALGATTNHAQSLADQGSVFQEVGETSTAITLHEGASDLWNEAIEARPQLADSMRQFVVNLEARLYDFYESKMDADGIDTVVARLKHQIDQVLPEGDHSAGALKSIASSTLSTDPEDSSTMSETGAIQFGNLASIEHARTIIGYGSVTAPCYRAIWARAEGDVPEMQRQFSQALAATRKLRGAERDFMETTVFAHQRRFLEATTAYRRCLAHSGGTVLGFENDLETKTSHERHGKYETRLEQQRFHELAASVFTQLKAYDDAKSHLDALERLAGTNWWAREGKPWESLSVYGEVHEGRRELRQALEYYSYAIQEFEKRRRLLSRDELKTALAGSKGSQFLYFCAARTALKLRAKSQQSSDRVQAYDYTATAFRYAEGGKARALLDLIAGSTMLTTSPKVESQSMAVWRQTAASLTRWRGLLAHEYAQDTPDIDRITYLNQKVETEEAELQQIETQLSVSDPDFYIALNPQASIMSLDEVSATLPPDTALLQYYFLRDELLAWAITRRQVETYQVHVDENWLD